MKLSELSNFLELQHPKRTLVIEDSVGFAKRLVEFLEEMGHEVWSLAGVETVTGDGVFGLSLDFETKCTVPLDVDLAFLDHYFVGKSHNGETMTRVLKQRGCGHIVAMSSDAGANLRMMEAGATLALRKRDLARMLG
jgi:CheY-like chemotaxis protein